MIENLQESRRLGMEERLGSAGIVPVLVLHNATDAVPVCRALDEGGLGLAEIALRTGAAVEALRRVRHQLPHFAVGAGTVTTVQELVTVEQAGAQFAMAPGLNPDILCRAQELGLPFVPGVATPSEVELALEHGCSLVKLFPAEVLGGLPALRALAGVYAHRGIRFVPSGGITSENLAAYLAHPTVSAVAMSGLVASDWVASRDWAQITRQARWAVDQVRAQRGAGSDSP